ncbi:MAG TPA: tetratricopeptide repeat protein, partial [Elusimicrobiales bacterium]|nr:tetratricopeptide repeat protein [Elusimicrobiales bacterium]
MITRISTILLTAILLPAVHATTGQCASAPKPEKLLRDGNKAFAAEKYDQALNSYSEALRVSPKDGRVYYNAANTLYKMQEYEKAVQSYD